MRQADTHSNVFPKRIASFDVARLVFAFWVVVVHVPIWGRIYLQPLACIAVPYFYMLTGFFCYDKDSTKLTLKLKNSLFNYGRLWIAYSVLLFGVICLLREFYPTEVTWTANQFKCFFLTYGNCTAFERLTIDGHNFGCSALWFLYGGALSLSIMYMFRKWLFSKMFVFVVIAVWISFVLLTYDGHMRFPRPIGASLPYLYLGAVINRYRSFVEEKMTLKSILLFFIFFLCLMYIEAFIFHTHGYGRFFLLPTAFCVFCAILRRPDYGNNFLNFISAKVSLDIYVWHRLWFCILAGVLGLKFYQGDAIVVYLSLFLISIFLRESSKLRSFYEKYI